MTKRKYISFENTIVLFSITGFFSDNIRNCLNSSGFTTPQYTHCLFHYLSHSFVIIMSSFHFPLPAAYPCYLALQLECSSNK